MGLGGLARLAEYSDEGFPNLFEVRNHTACELEKARSQFSDLAADDGTSVTQFGSWGRGELTEKSDDDWAIVVDGAAREDLLPSLEDVRKRLGAKRPKPGKQGIFGDYISCDSLVERVGLDHDTNANLTRRILLLLESVAVTGEDVVARCKGRVLDGYLDDSLKELRPPRFLLNDIVRYWRTICVDFVGKEREGDEKWGLRNAKLRTARKMLFASGLLPTLLCYGRGREEIRSYLHEQFEELATDRVAEAFLAFGTVDAGLRTFSAYDRWLGLIGSSDFRVELESVTRATAATSEAMIEVKRLSAELEAGLLTLLFDTALFAPIREYGIF